MFKYQVTKINIPNTESILTYINLKKATKIKVCTLSFQERNTTQSPYVNVCAQPQGTKDFFELIKAICLAMSAYSFIFILKFTVDGVSVESEDVCRTICDFLSGNVWYLSLVEPNHVYKALWYQIDGGSSIPTIVDWILDSSILR